MVIERLAICGPGFIGTAVKKMAESIDIETDILDADLCFISERVRSRLNKASHILCATGINGSARFNRDAPADIFCDNVCMNLNLMRALSLMPSKPKTCFILSSCGYPDGVPFHRDGYLESEYLQFEPNENAAAQAWAKRSTLLGQRYFNKQYGTRIISVIPSTVYGPGDKFDEDAKVVGALIRKIVGSPNNATVELWGRRDTMREFIFIDDLAYLILTCLNSYEDYYDPINLGFNEEVSVDELASLIAKLTHKKIEFQFKEPELAGVARKHLCNTKMMKLLSDIKTERLQPKSGYAEQAYTTLVEGLKLTIDWYKEHYVQKSHS